jgi:hypothetical protein
MKFITETRRFYYYLWVDTSVDGLLVPEGIIRPVVSASELTWYIRYIHYRNLYFLNNVINNKTKVLLPQAFLFTLFGFIASKTLNYLAFQNFHIERTR